MHKNAKNKNYAEYVPIGKAVKKIKKWQKQNVEIVYLTSRRTDQQINDIHAVLQKYNFPDGALEYRKNEEEYKNVVERVMPDILIEDDCESIGGEKEMICPHTSIVVQEFKGIDHLPDDATVLLQ